MHLEWSVEQARLYQLYATGLHARKYATGVAGIAACFRDLGSIQLDPLPVLGRNHDLVIQSRVDGAHPGETLDLIHRERLGFEYWDKALCAIAIESFAWFCSLMEAGGERWERAREERVEREHLGAIESVYRAIAEIGPLSSRELKGRKIA